MNHKQIVHFAVRCIRELDAHEGQPVSLREISAHQRIPLPQCESVVRRLCAAGIVELRGAESVILIRPAEQLTALEIVRAVWSEPSSFQMLVGQSRPGATQKTLAAIQEGGDHDLN